MGKIRIPAHRPFYSSLEKDLLAGRRLLLDRLALLAAPHAAGVRALAARGRHSSTIGLNIVGVGVGEKVSSGKRTSALAIKVLVAKKFPRSQVGSRDLIPATIEGLPTDVVAVGYPRKLTLANRLRFRPLQAGISVSPAPAATSPYVLAGTLGILARGRTSSRRYLISNNHVIANENAVSPGESVIQPASMDGGDSGDRIGRVSHVVELKFGNRRNWMDVAAAVIDENLKPGPRPPTVGIGPVHGTANVRLNSLVRKAGRTTGLTEGIVRTVKLDVLNIEYDGGMVRMEDVFAVEGVEGAFSRSGDSGSGVVNDKGAVVGLLFAGTDTQTFVIPIQRVLRRLKMKVL